MLSAWHLLGVAGEAEVAPRIGFEKQELQIGSVVHVVARGTLHLGVAGAEQHIGGNRAAKTAGRGRGRMEPAVSSRQRVVVGETHRVVIAEVGSKVRIATNEVRSRGTAEGIQRNRPIVA